MQELLDQGLLTMKTRIRKIGEKDFYLIKFLMKKIYTKYKQSLPEKVSIEQSIKNLGLGEQLKKYLSNVDFNGIDFGQDSDDEGNTRSFNTRPRRITFLN